MAETDEKGKNQSVDGLTRYSPELVRLLLTLIATAVAVATFFGIRVQKKELELSYLAKLSLVNPDLSSTGDVKVIYRGRDIRTLTKLSARLTNTGAVPIEKREIESPLLIAFDPQRAKILGANITGRNPGSIDATCNTTEKNEIILEHGLLNPADSVTFEVLFDGDPGSDLPQPR